MGRQVSAACELRRYAIKIGNPLDKARDRLIVWAATPSDAITAAEGRYRCDWSIPADVPLVATVATIGGGEG